MSMSEPEFTNDLDWMAFCYVADELSGDQLAQFESRLENDQAAREAVAEAVKISTAVFECDAASTPIPTREVSASTSTSRASQWVLVIAAALLVGVGLAAWIANSNSGPTEIVAELNDEDLAIAWADTIQEVDINDSADEFLDEFQLASSESGSDEGDEAEWMYVAFTELELDGDEELTQ